MAGVSLCLRVFVVFAALRYKTRLGSNFPCSSFSKRSNGKFTVSRTALRSWVTLMTRLGYERFGAQGGDWGSAVTCALAALAPERLEGIHVNMPTVPLGPIDEGSTERERRAVDDFAWHQQWGTGYQLLQSTRPQTLGYGLVDSPVGQLAWIVEKFWAWTDCDGDPLSLFTRDQLLDNVTVFWFTGTGASSGRASWAGKKLGRRATCRATVGGCQQGHGLSR